MAFFSREKDAFLVCAAVNTLTNLPFNLILLLLRNLAGIRPGYWALLPAEAGIVLIEGLFYKGVLKWPRRKAFAAALVLNALSYGIGFFLLS